MRVYKVFRPDEGGKHWVTRDFQTIADSEFDGAEVGDRVVIELGEMSEAEIAALPEFEGW